MADIECDVLIVGGGTGGCAAAMAASSLGARVVMTEPTSMIGGQLTSQMVPPDEHRWIEEFGCTARYREYRTRIRDWYRPKFKLPIRDDPFLNPGGGWVSRLCHSPEAGCAALAGMLMAPIEAGTLVIKYRAEIVSADTDGDSVTAVRFRSLAEESDFTVACRFVLDATELGDLAPLSGAEYRLGSESVAEFGEPHATEFAEPGNIQGFTWCFALATDSKHPYTMEKPESYEFWRQFVPPGWPGPQLSFTFPNPITGEPRTLPLTGSDLMDRASLFAYRQIADRSFYREGESAQDITSVNWPQNDYFGGAVIDVPPEVKAQRLAASKDLDQCLLYWLKTEALGSAMPDLGPARSLIGTDEGFALAPYHRESRRLVTRLTVTEQMVAAECNPGLDRAPAMTKSVGVGHYRIDLHPSANGHGYIDIPSLPFQIPLGALIPVRLTNLLPACKNLGVTHITNGCYRLHPVEWNLGEAAGLLAGFSIQRGVTPAAVYESARLWEDFERLLHAQGVETHWPDLPLV